MYQTIYLGQSIGGAREVNDFSAVNPVNPVTNEPQKNWPY